MKRATMIVLFTAAALGTPITAIAQSRGGFQPPIYSTDDDVTYVSGTGVLTFAGPLTLGGAVVFTGTPLGDPKRPLFGLELTVGAFYGQGTLETGLAAGFGGPQLDLSLMMATVTPVLKLKPLDERDNGVFGFTLYAGGQLGTSTVLSSNGLGSAAATSLLVGALGGGVATVRLGGWVSVLAFGGGQYSYYLSPEDSRGILVPTYGGNIKVHLTPSWSLDLGSMLSQLAQQDDARDSVKVFMLGVTWSDRTGLSVHEEGILP